MAIIEVDLSRLDSMIRNARQELASVTEEKINGDKLVFSFKVYARTSAQDMDGVKGNVLAARQDFYDAVDDARRRLAYITYLCEAREEANNKSGISSKLVAKAGLDRALICLAEFLDNAKRGAGAKYPAAVPVTSLREPEYYQSAFTENCRTEEVLISALNQADVRYFQSLRDKILKEQRGLMDEIAQLNRHTKTAVMDFEEFAARLQL